jgi:hypothetical protein
MGAGPDIDHGRRARAIVRPLPETPGFPVPATVRPVAGRG